MMMMVMVMAMIQVVQRIVFLTVGMHMMVVITMPVIVGIAIGLVRLFAFPIRAAPW